MDTRRIELDAETTERCVVFASGLVQRYATGATPLSLAVSSRGAERNERLQAKAKMAECILAIWLGEPLDPLFEQNTRPWDIRARFVRIDVKQTGLRGQYLIWPKRKNDIFLSKEFDVLVLVKNDWNVGFPHGWIRKYDFFRLKTVAGEDHKLDVGTWHIDQDLLEVMDMFPAQTPRYDPYFDDWGTFCHPCSICGDTYAPFGYDYFPPVKLGQWFCRDHRPGEMS